MARKKFGKFDDKKLGILRFEKEFIVIAIAVFLLLKFVVGLSWVSGNSMYPTLKNNQPVFYNRLAKNYERGDIVSIRMPSGEYMVKRIVAVAGDTVDLRDGTVYINDVAESGDWVTQASEPQSVTVSYPLTISEGHVFVLGDNREVSIDSRTYGQMAMTQIRGRLMADGSAGGAG